MTLEDLQHIFRHQTTTTEEYTPSSVLEYMLIENNDKLPGKVNSSELETLVPLLDNFVFEGYKNRVPYFVKPEVHIEL
jgi:hypothetical protein